MVDVSRKFHVSYITYLLRVVGRVEIVKGVIFCGGGGATDDAHVFQTRPKHAMYHEARARCEVEGACFGGEYESDASNPVANGSKVRFGAFHQVVSLRCDRRLRYFTGGDTLHR